MCIYTYSVILALRFESFSENTVLHVFTDLKRFDAGERIFKRLELSKQRSPCSTYGYLCLIDRSIFLQLTSTDDCAAPHGTRDTKINDGKSQIKSRKKLTKKKTKKKRKMWKSIYIVSYKQPFDTYLPDYFFSHSTYHRPWSFIY